MQKFDLYWVKWKYEDDPDKLTIRPGLVLSATGTIVPFAKVTTKEPRNQFEGEYNLQKWNEAGLTEESTVRLSKIIKATPKDILEPIGHLDKIDQTNIEKELARLRIMY